MSPELIIQKLKNLPQGKFLNESNLAHYASILSLHDDKKADWLIGRLAGIGGSETGILVSGLRNEADVFGASPSDLIAEKLLIAKPVQENNAMLMGIYMEAFVRERFYATYGAARHEVAYAALCVAKHPSHEWMRYSPDDIVVMDGKNYLVDYKTPAEASSMSKIPMRYKAQLHQGFELCRVSDIEIEGLLLIQLPLDNRTLYVTEVDIDESIVRDIKTAGSEAWHDYILQGALPSRDAKDYLFDKFTEADTKVQQKILTLSDKHEQILYGVITE